MKRVGTVFVITVACLVAFSATGKTVATTMQVCPPKAQFLCDADAITEKESHDREVKGAIERGLCSQEKDARDVAYRFASDWRLRRLDLRSLKPALECFDALEQADRGHSLLVDAEFYLAPRDARLQAYRRAILDGEARVGERLVLRSDAIWAACYEGLGELKPLIDEWLPKLPRETRDSLEREGRLALLELRAGASDHEDGTRRAVERLAASAPENLARRLVKEEGFRRAVSDVAEEACRDTTTEECSTMGRLLSSQEALFLSTVEQRQHEQQKGTRLEMNDEEQMFGDWLKGVARPASERK